MSWPIVNTPACPNCGAKTDILSPVGNCTPKTGDITLCMYCAHVMFVEVGDNGVSVRAPTAAESAWVDSEPTLSQMRDDILDFISTHGVKPPPLHEPPKPAVLITETNADACDYVVCMRSMDMPPQGYFADDEFGVCCECGEKVRFRPYLPKTPPKICMRCLPKLTAKEPLP